MKQNAISRSVIERLPLYLHYLKSSAACPVETVSATAIARALNLGEVQVRKDLALISGAGKPKVGYVTADLIAHLESFLSDGTVNSAVVVGAGKLGMALLDYEGFGEYGLCIPAGFDLDEKKAGCTETGKRIYPVSAFPAYCIREKPRIGIITVPERAAQQVCDMMVENGLLAIWNFAPVRLHAPDGILVRNENMASSLAVLSGHLNNRLG